ncbi:hypothetical protein [Anaerococcus sp. Marseille-P3625]|uniref:hypothetical protein n=1 Tax=Anaerococcus sp. Marseille-P3625 TaxID=1977277 RepID=UPI000C0717F3|nr:hypothetical protein [Anaerococcus sp. Marseille-P3625]
MKKIIKFLIAITLILSSLTYFFYVDSNQAIGKFPDFDKFINLVNYEDKDIRKEIEKYALKNNINLVKFDNKIRYDIKDKMDVNAYLFLADYSRFTENHRDLIIKENPKGVNKFECVKENNFLSRNNIDIIKFEDLNIDNISGDYAVSGNNEDLDKFIEDLSDFADIKKTPDYMSVSNITMKEFFLGLVVNFIIIFATLFAIVIYNRSLTKEISVSLLFGYSDIKLALGKTINILMPSFILAIVIDWIIFFKLTNPDSIGGFLLSMNPIYKFVAAFTLVIFILEFFLLFFKTSKEEPILIIKGQRKTSAKLLFPFKMIFAACICYMFFISIFSAKDYLYVKNYLNDWRFSKYYANISVGLPWQYVIDKDQSKYEKLFTKPTTNLAYELIDKGAVIFSNPYEKREALNFTDNTLKEYRLNNGKFAYINSNYIKKFDILDADGRKISDDIEKNEWKILVPENIKLNNNDLDYIKRKQLEQTDLNEENLITTFIKIKANQKLAKLDSQAKIDDPFTNNYVFILINENSIGKDDDLLSYFLVNGYLHPYLENKDVSLKELKKFINRNPASKYVLWIESTFNYVNYQVNKYKIEMLIYIFGTILFFVIYSLIIILDKNNYYLNHGEELAVKSLFGYEFKDIHKKKIKDTAISYLFSLIIFYIIINFTNRYNYFGFFTPRNDRSNADILIGLALSFILLLGLYLIELKILKDNDKLTIKLKEGN